MSPSAVVPDWTVLVNKFVALADSSEHWETPEVGPSATDRIYRSNAGKIRYKAEFTLAVSPSSAADLLNCIPRRHEWDTLCAQAEKMGEVEGWTIMYICTHPQWPAQAREEVLWVGRRDTDDGIYLLGTTCDVFEYPVKGAGVKMRTAIGGSRIRAHKDGCIVTHLFDSDPGGLLPSYIVRKVSAVAVPKNIRLIRELAK
ncbi:hypothetical protein PSACC_00144 [Paramicrosporidium saccamoebae]|uniref:START domain-containing protein n=1 Tax=Paramicrosporidium saccamoebae TaxID=1246581 RepID=A0A2H9TQL4_9FUNG|nr:hypothetical protein PSACC_00144 [Paramicrosporidium saccamoebae]